MTDQQPTSVPPPPTAQVPAYEVWQPAPPQPPARGRVPGWILAVAVGTAVASVAAFVTVLVWPSGEHEPAGPLDFHGFTRVDRVAYDEPSRTTLSAVHGEQGYTAWEQDGDLRVVAFEIATGEVHWREQVTGVPRWHRLLATPEVLLVLAYEESESEPRAMFARDAETGAERWRVDVRGEDRLIFTEGTLGVLDREGEVLRGLDWASGTERWRHEFEGSAQAVGVTTPAGLAQPTDPGGANLSPVGTDERIALLTADRTLRVIDGRDGGPLLERGNVADPANDLLLAHDDRLFVAADQGGYRVESYSLDDSGQPPTITYTSTDPDRHPDDLVPCGDGRLCVLDTVPFDDDSIEARAVSIEDGRELWHHPVPGAQRAIPVGDWLVVNREVDFDPVVTVLDGGGQERADQPGLGVRLNDGNLLLFGAALDSGEEQVRAVGVPIEVGAPEELGPLPSVEPAGCTWNDRYVVCAGRDGAEIWRFANDD